MSTEPDTLRSTQTRSSEGSVFAQAAPRLDELCRAMLLVGALIFLVLLARVHAQMVSIEIPLDYYEPGMLAITNVIANGLNPYSLEMQPSNGSVYPPLYNMVVAPLTFAFENTLQLHRIITALFIVGACVLCYLAVYRQNESHVFSLSAAVAVYAGLLFYSTPIAGPNGLGVFFFLAALLTPWAYGFSARSLAASILFGILAFLAKQYFVVVLAYVPIYLLICVSIRRAVIFGFFALIASLVTATAIHLSSPYFFDNVLFSMRSAASMTLSTDRMISQVVYFGQTYASLLVLLTGGVVYETCIRRPRSYADNGNARGSWLNLKDLSSPLLNLKIDYLWFCLACSFIVIAVLLGRHAGNYMTYLFQLMSPFLIIGGLAYISKSRLPIWIIVPPLLLLLFQMYFSLPKHLDVDTSGWDRVEEILVDKQEVFATPIALTELVKDGKTIYANGHTRFLFLAMAKPNAFKRAAEEERVETVWKKHVQRIQDKIRARQFDVILLDQWTRLPDQISALDTGTSSALLEEHYRLSERISVHLAADRPGDGRVFLQVWEPIANGGG